MVTMAAASAAVAAPPAANPHTTSTSATSTSKPAAHVHTTATAPPAHHTAAAEPDIHIPYGPSNALWSLQPADSSAWKVTAAPGVFNVTAHFAVKDQDKVVATFKPPQPFVGFEFWGYQRADGGMYALLIDGVQVAPIDVYNKTAGAHDKPVLLYNTTHLERVHHVVQLRNLVDPRTHKAGEFNIDHVVITAAADAPRTESGSTKPAPTKPGTKDPQPTQPPSKNPPPKDPHSPNPPSKDPHSPNPPSKDPHSPNPPSKDPHQPAPSSAPAPSKPAPSQPSTIVAAPVPTSSDPAPAPTSLPQSPSDPGSPSPDSPSDPESPQNGEIDSPNRARSLAAPLVMLLVSLVLFV